MAAPAQRGAASIVDATGVNAGTITPAPAVRPTPRMLMATVESVQDPQKLLLLVRNLQAEMDALRDGTRSVFYGSVFVRAVSFIGGATKLIEHKMGREVMGVLVTAPMVPTATAVAGVFAVVRVALPSGRDPRRFVAMFAHESCTADLLIF